MADAAVTSSDEPTKLADIVVPIFQDEISGWRTSLSSGATMALAAGVLAQDDCAIFQARGDQDIVLGSDYIRGSKFRLYELGYLSNFDVGYYLAMANFSDIAAMGAEPVALLSVVRYPKSMSDKDFRSVIEGIKSACDKVGARNVGGDIGTAERLILSATAVGSVEPGGALRRNTAGVGEVLCLTGPTGVAGAAQQYFYHVSERGRELDDLKEDELLRAWRRPVALIEHGRQLSLSGTVTSCQDTSDGLKAAIESIAASSGLGFIIRECDIPVPSLVEEVAYLRDLSAIDIVFGDSVDFQLIFTIPEAREQTIRKQFRSLGLDFVSIGVSTSACDVILERRDGTVGELPGQAWRHSS